MDPVVIKGTRYGLLASIREDADFGAAMADLKRQLQEKKDFLAGGSLSVDFGWRETDEKQFAKLEAVLEKAGLVLNGILSTSLNTRTIAEQKGYKAIIGRLGLAKHQGRAMRRRKEEPVSAPTPVEDSPVTELVKEPLNQQEPEEVVETSASACGPEEQTLYLRKTLRSGQKVVFSGNVVLYADVNPGAEIEAEGDILVLGNLRGAVHAGCEGDNEASVMALVMQPTQLRINDHFLNTHSGTRKARKVEPTRAVLKAGEVQLLPYTIR